METASGFGQPTTFSATNQIAHNCHGHHRRSEYSIYSWQRTFRSTYNPFVEIRAAAGKDTLNIEYSEDSSAWWKQVRLRRRTLSSEQGPQGRVSLGDQDMQWLQGSNLGLYVYLMLHG